MNTDLLVAELMVRASLKKEAVNWQQVGEAAGKVVRAPYHLIGGMTRGGAQAAKELVPGVGGKALGLGIRAAPWVGGAYLTNVALGDPAGRGMQSAKRRWAARRAQHQAAYDPRTGVFY